MPDSPSQSFFLVNGLVLFAAGCALVPLAVALARHLFPQRVVFFARWGFSHLALVFFTGLLSVWCTGLAVQSMSGEKDGLTLLGAGLIPFVAVCAIIVYFADRMHPESWRALGAHRGGGWQSLAVGVSTFVLVLPLLFGTGLVWHWLWPKLGGVWESQPIAEMLLALPAERLVWAAVIAVVVQPLCEELIFRGFLQPLFVQNFGALGGIVVTSLLFAGLHGSGSAFLQIFVLSLVLGAVMLRTHRLAGVWLIHALNNGLMLGLLYWAPEGTELLQ